MPSLVGPWQRSAARRERFHLADSGFGRFASALRALAEGGFGQFAFALRALAEGGFGQFASALRALAEAPGVIAFSWQTVDSGGSPPPAGLGREAQPGVSAFI